MKYFRIQLITPLALSAMLLVGGCASPNVNPTSPRANTGYVDLYADFAGDLCWDVQRFDAAANTFQKVFYNLDPLEGRILRLGFSPGRHKLRVTFLNHLIAEPALFEVEVRDGEITPVQVKLSEAGVTSVQTKSTSVGGTAYGRYGRRTKIGSYQGTMYRVSAVPQPIQPYGLKEQKFYAH